MKNKKEITLPSSNQTIFISNKIEKKNFTFYKKINLKQLLLIVKYLVVLSIELYVLQRETQWTNSTVFKQTNKC